MKKEELVPDVDIKFSKFREAGYYLHSVAEKGASYDYKTNG